MERNCSAKARRRVSFEGKAYEKPTRGKKKIAEVEAEGERGTVETPPNGHILF